MIVGFSGFLCGLGGFTVCLGGFYWVFYWILMGFMGFCRGFVVSIALEWVLVGFYRVLPSFTGFDSSFGRCAQGQTWRQHVWKCIPVSNPRHDCEMNRRERERESERERE